MNIYYEKSKSLLLEMTGSLLVAIGLANFAAAFEFPMTGFSGIALILYRLFHIPLGFTNLILNIPMQFSVIGFWENNFSTDHYGV